MTSISAFVFALPWIGGLPMPSPHFSAVVPGTLIGVQFAGKIGNAWIKRFSPPLLVMLIKLVVGK